MKDDENVGGNVLKITKRDIDEIFEKYYLDFVSKKNLDNDANLNGKSVAINAELIEIALWTKKRCEDYQYVPTEEDRYSVIEDLTNCFLGMIKHYDLARYEFWDFDGDLNHGYWKERIVFVLSVLEKLPESHL